MFQRGPLPTYAGPTADRVAFPLGGLGAGMVCLSGTGALTSVSVRNAPALLNEPFVFAAVRWATPSGTEARVIEGPVPTWKITYPWPDSTGTGRGQQGKTFGLPRFATSRFAPRFPFADLSVETPQSALACRVVAWSPFSPGDADASSLPVASLEYEIENRSDERAEAIFSFHARNFMRVAGAKGPAGVDASGARITLWQAASPERPEDQGAFTVECDADDAVASARWFRGGWWDPVTDLWRGVVEGRIPEAGAHEGDGPSDGGSLYVPFNLEPGETRRVCLRLSWHVPVTSLRRGGGPFDPAGRTDGTETYAPWYASQFADPAQLAGYWAEHYARLRAASEAFATCLADQVLPAEVLDAVTANLSILKSPTVMRQADGRLWMWEGCADNEGSFEGSCTHVFNYAQSIPHLFPALERTLRETEFFENQDDRGHQNFRAQIPIRPNPRRARPAADGQFGGIVKVYRDWRICGDDVWLRTLWPQVTASLEYAIRTWDPAEAGWLTAPHHNTYDIEFWGPDGMAGTIYLSALQAAAEMAEALGEPSERYRALSERAKQRLENDLFNGEYFIQQVQWDEQAWAGDLSPESSASIQADGPKYQYGGGCLSDGVLGEWLARVSGLESGLDGGKVLSHLRAVHRHNFRHSLRDHANPQRPAYALGDEAALLLCTWPRGGTPHFPFVYSDEAWTGIEYQVAAHLIFCGEVGAGLEIVRAARSRYDGRVRNPFSEFEWGHFYGRAMSSWSLLQAMTGQDYDARTRRLTLAPKTPGDVSGLLATETGFALVGVRDGTPFVEVRGGELIIDAIDYTPFERAS
ncbi:MAG: GH116 family glycosyl hydrolase [Phenylobacterium sp.]|nr:GH116 family glycosyl hydrolase [Phenylobacterium sp.]